MRSISGITFASPNWTNFECDGSRWMKHINITQFIRTNRWLEFDSRERKNERIRHVHDTHAWQRCIVHGWQHVNINIYVSRNWMLRIGHDHSIVSDAGSIYQNVIYTRQLTHYSFIYFRCLRSANATEYQFMHDIYAVIGDVSDSKRFRLPGSLSVGRMQALFGSVTESTFANTRIESILHSRH